MAEIKRVELKSLTLKSPLEAWILDERHKGRMSKAEAYLVPEIGRAIDIVAGAVVAYPFGIYKGEAEVTERYTLDGWWRLLWAIAADYLVFGKWYVLIEKNKYGVTKPRRLLPTSVEPSYDKATGHVTRFVRTTQDGETAIAPEQMVYDHASNPFGELGAGPSALDRALNAAGISDSQSKMLKAYYERGAPLTLFSYGGVIDQAEGKSLVDWWNNVIRRGQEAYRAVLMRGDVKPNVFGSNARDAFTPEIMSWMRQQICIAFGIPISVMESSASNFATAESDRAVLQENTVRPIIERIFSAWNDQYYSKQGVELWAEHDATNAASVAFANKAKALSELAGKPVLTVDEARQMLDLDPMPEQEQPAPAPVVEQQPPQDAQMEDEQKKGETQPAEKSFTALRKAALAAFDAGAPLAVGTPFDKELAACKSKAAIRAVFERNWPSEGKRAAYNAEALLVLAEEIRAAREALKSEKPSVIVNPPSQPITLNISPGNYARADEGHNGLSPNA